MGVFVLGRNCGPAGIPAIPVAEILANRPTFHSQFGGNYDFSLPISSLPSQRSHARCIPLIPETGAVDGEFNGNGQGRVPNVFRIF